MVRARRELYAWVVWVVFVAVLYYLGSRHLHLPLQNMGLFILGLALLCLALLLTLRFVYASGKAAATGPDRGSAGGPPERRA